MRKKRIHLNESQFATFIKRTVKSVLREMEGDEEDFSDVYPDEVSPEDRQSQIDSDWNDIEAADDDFNKESEYMRDFKYKNNDNIHNKQWGYLAMQAQEPTVVGGLARDPVFYTSLQNDDSLMNGYKHNFSDHNIQDDCWNRPDY